MDAAEALSPPPGPSSRGDAGSPLAALSGLVRPLVPASELTLPIPGALGEAVPALRRGTVVSVDGPPGRGATSVALGLAAAAGAVGEWAAWFGGPAEIPALGALAAEETGVVLERLVVVPEVPRGRWGMVAGALVEGVSLVVAETPRGVRVADARRLVTRVREQRAVLVVLGAWPERVTTRIRVDAVPWSIDHGRLVPRRLEIEIEEHGRSQRRSTRTAPAPPTPSIRSSRSAGSARAARAG